MDNNGEPVVEGGGGIPEIPDPLEINKICAQTVEIGPCGAPLYTLPSTQPLQGQVMVGDGGLVEWTELPAAGNAEQRRFLDNSIGLDDFLYTYDASPLWNNYFKVVETSGNSVYDAFRVCDGDDVRVLAFNNPPAGTGDFEEMTMSGGTPSTGLIHYNHLYKNYTDLSAFNDLAYDEVQLEVWLLTNGSATPDHVFNVYLDIITSGALPAEPVFDVSYAPMAVSPPIATGLTTPNRIITKYTFSINPKQICDASQIRVVFESETQDNGFLGNQYQTNIVGNAVSRYRFSGVFNSNAVGTIIPEALINHDNILGAVGRNTHDIIDSYIVSSGADIVDLQNDKVNGPASSTDNNIVAWDGTTGKLLKNSTITINGDDIEGNKVYLADGTVSNPSFSFKNDANSGLFKDGDDLKLAVNGSEALKMQSTATSLSPAVDALAVEYGASSGCYSVRKLVGAYGGFAMNITDDNATTIDIGFDGDNQIDKTVFDTLVEPVYINTWYDQSANNRNLTGVVGTGGSAKKPQLIFEAIGSGFRPSIVFNFSKFVSTATSADYGLNSNDHSIIINFKTTQGATSYMTTNTVNDYVNEVFLNSSGLGIRCFDDGSGVSSANLGVLNDFTDGNWYVSAGGANSSPTQTSAVRLNADFDYGNTQVQIVDNNPISFGNRFVGDSNYFDGEMSEIIIFGNNWVYNSPVWTTYWNNAISYWVNGLGSVNVGVPQLTIGKNGTDYNMPLVRAAGGNKYLKDTLGDGELVFGDLATDKEMQFKGVNVPSNPPVGSINLYKSLSFPFLQIQDESGVNNPICTKNTSLTSISNAIAVWENAGNDPLLRTRNNHIMDDFSYKLSTNNNPNIRMTNTTTPPVPSYPIGKLEMWANGKGGEIAVQTTQIWSGSNKGSKMIFSTNDTNTSTTIEKMIISDDVEVKNANLICSQINSNSNLTLVANGGVNALNIYAQPVVGLINNYKLPFNAGSANNNSILAFNSANDTLEFTDNPTFDELKVNKLTVSPALDPYDLPTSAAGANAGDVLIYNDFLSSRFEFKSPAAISNPYGSQYHQDNTTVATVTSPIGTYVSIASSGSRLAGQINGFISANDGLTYTGTQTSAFLVNYSCTSQSVSNPDELFAFGVFVNTNLIIASRTTDKKDNTNIFPTQTAGSAIVILSTNDKVDLRAANLQGSNSLRVRDMLITITKC